MLLKEAVEISEAHITGIRILNDSAKQNGVHIDALQEALDALTMILNYVKDSETLKEIK